MFQLCVYATTLEDNSQETHHQNKHFDSDTQFLMIDGGASACIMNLKEDFIDEPLKISRKVKGIKGHARATQRGTVRWLVEDDNQLVHAMTIQGVYLVPEATTRIMSPQHLAPQVQDHSPYPEGTGSINTSKSVTIFWNQRKYDKTVPLDPKLNVGMTTTVAGSKRPPQWLDPKLTSDSDPNWFNQ